MTEETSQDNNTGYIAEAVRQTSLCQLSIADLVALYKLAKKKERYYRKNPFASNEMWWYKFSIDVSTEIDNRIKNIYPFMP